MRVGRDRVLGEFLEISAAILLQEGRAQHREVSDGDVDGLQNKVVIEHLFALALQTADQTILATLHQNGANLVDARLDLVFVLGLGRFLF